MIDPLQVSLLVLALILCLADVMRLRRKEGRNAAYGDWIRKIAKRPRLVAAALACVTFLGCIAVAVVLYEPVPRTQDEFSYLLMADTFAHGRVANPAPRLPEFFDTLEVLVHPAYVSKYFPAQGVFLAIGEKLTDHPAVGLWLSSALACVATYWMLQAWAGPVWGLVGGLLMMIQWGVFSYWSQSYWGGMVAALGGALCFGALRRLWDRLSWSSAVWFGLGAVILVNSRPLEGVCAVGAAAAVVLYRAWRSQHRPAGGFWRSLVIPAGGVLLLGAAVTTAYNHATTGSAFNPPYLEHERQYQETPIFFFLPLHPQITYSNPRLATFYDFSENSRYRYKRLYLPCDIVQTLRDWWYFYCCFPLSLLLLIPVLLRRGWIRYVQLAVLAGLIVLAAYFYSMTAIGASSLIDVLVIVQVVLLWLVFDGFWQRLSISTIVLLLLLACISKWGFPHYSAPVACLSLFLQVDGLCRIWHWRSQAVAENAQSPRWKRRQAASSRNARLGSGATLRFGLRNLVYLFPLLCALSMVERVVVRMNGVNSQDSLAWDTLNTAPGDQGLARASMQRWLEQKDGPQLVFVHYAPSGNANSSWVEWVYNDADLSGSKVIWARDMGAEHNELLLNQLPARNVWLLDANDPNLNLSPYGDAIRRYPAATEPLPNRHD
jgi:hypothetical protein